MTHDLNSTTRLTIKPCPTDQHLHEVLIERDVGLKDGTLTKTQMFMTDDEIGKFRNLLVMYCNQI
jgi:hypothetical protein